jgi:ABC-type lipoprotein release transport system permease subunit
MFLNTFRLAFRRLLSDKGFTFINMTGLATGICACIAIYTVASYELSFDNFHPGRDRIYRVGARITEHDEYGYGEDAPPPAAAALKQEIPGIEASAHYYPYQTPKAPNAILTDANYFSMFPYHWLAGDPNTALNNPFSVVLTESRARHYFGPARPDTWIGRSVIYEDSLDVHVTGIVSDWTGNTDFPFTDLISLSTVRSSFLHNSFHPDSWQVLHGNQWAITFIKLAPHAKPDQVAKQLPPFVKRHLNDPVITFFHLALVLQPLADIHFNPAYSHDGIRKARLPVLYALMGVAIFILLLAVINFINLSTAQALRRAKETDIRRILGGSRTQLMLRFLTETAVIVTLAAILGALLVRPVFTGFQAWLPPEIHFHPFDALTLLFILGLTLATTTIAGIYPARLLTDTKPPKRYTVRKTLIVFQFTISLLFIIGSIAVSRQLHYMLNADPGFAKDAILTITDYDAPAEKLRVLAQQAKHLSGITATTLQGHAPGGQAIMEFPIQLDGRKDRETLVAYQEGDPNFLAFYHIKLLAGRNFVKNDSSLEVMLNDTYRLTLGFAHPADALGHFVTWNNKKHPIVAVIPDFHSGSFRDPVNPLLLAYEPEFQQSVAFRVNNPKTSLPQLEKLWRSNFPDKTFRYSWLDQSLTALYQNETQLVWLLHAATSITIFISCMGLLGLILYIVEKRKKEISIRKVLGAGVANIALLLNKEFIILIGISLLIAAPIAWLALQHWLREFAFHTSLPWWIFAQAGIVALAIAVATISFRVLKAAAANPIKNLRSPD